MITTNPDTKKSGRRSGSDRRVFADPNYKGFEKRVTGDRRKGTRKRSHQRFKAKEGAYAAIEADHNIIGMIMDISKGGLSFQYVFDGREVSGSVMMDILRKGKVFHLKNVPFKITSDFPIDKKVPSSTIILRHCGGKFEVLTDEQTSQLDTFINNYTLSND